jgi:hypothetical protein
VDIPQAVLVEIPIVTDSVSLVPLEEPDSPPREVVALANGRKLLSADLERLAPAETESLTEADVAFDPLSPTVLV